MGVKQRLRRAGYSVTCNRPPRGWWCSAEARHDGPCPTYPSWFNLRGMRQHLRNRHG